MLSGKRRARGSRPSPGGGGRTPHFLRRGPSPAGRQDRRQFVLLEEEQGAVREAVGVVVHVAAPEQEDAVAGPVDERVPQGGLLRPVADDADHAAPGPHSMVKYVRSGRKRERVS